MAKRARAKRYSTRSLLPLAGLVFVSLASAGCGDEQEPPPREDAAAVRAVSGGTSVPPLASLPDFELPLSVAEAYAAIPHRQTRFRFGAIPLAAGDRAYLEAMFHLVDQGTRVRVVAWQELDRHDATASDPVGKLTALIGSVGAIQPPAHLAAYHAEIRRALAEQRAFFQEWLAAGKAFRARSGPALASHPAVQASHRALLAAYGVLMRELGEGLPTREREAFFDHHCALDFL